MWGAAELTTSRLSKSSAILNEKPRRNKAATVSQDMELWATGFNAWGQLDFQGESFLAPADLRTFNCILRSKHLEMLRTSLSATLGKLLNLTFLFIISFYSCEILWDPVLPIAEVDLSVESRERPPFSIVAILFSFF